jgi:hypothetical protein
MNQHIIDDGVARRFLLGQLSTEEQGRIEQLAFADPAVFEFLQAAENDLMDEFLYDELSPQEKTSFEKYVLTKPGRRRDLRIARALRQYLDQENQPSEVVPLTVNDSERKISFWQRLGLGAATGPLVAAAVVIVAIGVIVLIIWAIRRDEAPPLQAQQQQATPIPTPSASSTEAPSVTTPTPAHKETPVQPTPSPRKPAIPVYAVVLTPGGPSRSESDEVVLALPSDSVEFELPVIRETTYPRYQALLQKDERTIHSWNKLRPQKRPSGKAVVVTLPPGVLEKSLRYRIVLNGMFSRGKPQELHTYHFKISDTEIR